MKRGTRPSGRERVWQASSLSCTTQWRQTADSRRNPLSTRVPFSPYTRAIRCQRWESSATSPPLRGESSPLPLSAAWPCARGLGGWTTGRAGQDATDAEVSSRTVRAIADRCERSARRAGSSGTIATFQSGSSFLSVANDRTERAALLRFLLSFLSLSSHSPALPFAPASRHRNHGFPSIHRSSLLLFPPPHRHSSSGPTH